jgi:hypothetical protein
VTDRYPDDRDNDGAEDGPDFPKARRGPRRWEGDEGQRPRRGAFAYRAARLAWVLPLAALGVGFAARPATRGFPAAELLVGAATVLMVLAAPVFAVVALAGVRRLGGRGLVAPALTGLALSLLLLAGVAAVAVLAFRGGLPSPDDLGVRNRIVGTWECREPGSVIELRLSGDGTFRFLLTGSSVADFSGRWSVQRNRLYLTVERVVDGRRERIGDRVTWPIERAGETELVLRAGDGTDRYTRKGPAN